MGVLELGTKALVANQAALQTVGHNITNVNTPGYSRQRTIFTTTEGQYTGGGYIGKGVDLNTITRTYSEFLTRQATLAGATQAGDTARADKLKLLEGIFEGGSNGLGAAINDMLNAFSDVASAPTDLTARTVVLTRLDETAARFRATAQRLEDLQLASAQGIGEKINAANNLATSIAQVNQQIAAAKGSGQPPNDLLDRREQLVRELNQYVQTSSIMADDGTMSLFVGGSQALVLGAHANTLATSKNEFGEPGSTKLALVRDGVAVQLDEAFLGGGEIPGLVRFQNSDLVEGRNLLGRLTLSITTAMNDQHKLGLDLDGNAGGNLFTQITLGSANVLVPKQQAAPAPQVTLNTGDAALSVAIQDVTRFAASDYEITFSSATAGSIVRKSDGVVSAFDFASTPTVNVDGLDITMPSGTPAAGDRFLIKPYSTAASNVQRQFSLPRALAVASPVVTKLGSSNTGSLQLTSLKVNGQPSGLSLPPSPTAPATTGAGVQLTFVAGPPQGYTVSGTTAVPESYAADPSNPPYVPGTTVVTFTPGEAISIDGWQLTLTGAAKTGDTVTVGNALDSQYGTYYQRNAGNASAMMDLRDKAMFDGSALTDGYAGLMAQIGIRTQSAEYAATVSSTIATNLERDRTSVSGVNLDEEAAKLIQFQQAYQASAKMVQIAQSIFNDLLQGIAR
ncbi:MAG: flagellar hook-associated protein FlgK [Rhodoferax sp.]